MLQPVCSQNSSKKQQLLWRLLTLSAQADVQGCVQSIVQEQMMYLMDVGAYALNADVSAPTLQEHEDLQAK